MCRCFPGNKKPKAMIFFKRVLSIKTLPTTIRRYLVRACNMLLLHGKNSTPTLTNSPNKHFTAKHFCGQKMLSWPLLFLSLSISSVFDCPTTANYSRVRAHPVYRKGLRMSSQFVFVAILNYKDDFFILLFKTFWKNYSLGRFVLCYLYSLNILLRQFHQRKIWSLLWK